MHYNYFTFCNAIYMQYKLSFQNMRVMSLNTAIMGTPNWNIG